MGVTLTVLGPFMTTNLVSASATETPAVTENAKLDAEIKPYAKVSGVSGTINSIGSDMYCVLISRGVTAGPIGRSIVCVIVGISSRAAGISHRP